MLIGFVRTYIQTHVDNISTDYHASSSLHVCPLLSTRFCCVLSSTDPTSTFSLLPQCAAKQLMHCTKKCKILAYTSAYHVNRKVVQNGETLVRGNGNALDIRRRTVIPYGGTVEATTSVGRLAIFAEVSKLVNKI